MKSSVFKIFITIICLWLGISAYATSFFSGGCKYEIDPNNPGEVTLTGYENVDAQEHSETLVIPDTVTFDGNKYVVSKMGEAAFYGIQNMPKRVVIPGTMTEIPKLAFANSSMTSLEIQEGVVHIGEAAFQACKSLIYVSFPSTLTQVDHYAFGECYAMSDIKIADMGSWCEISFQDATATPFTSSRVSDRTIISCSDEVTSHFAIPEGCTKIKQYVFNGFTSIKSIYIPKSMQSVVLSGLSSNVTAVHISDLVAWCGIHFDAYANPLFVAHHLYVNGELLTDLVVPDTLTELLNYAFEGCTDIKSVTIHPNVKKIGFGVFDRCTGLESVHIQDLDAWCNMEMHSNPLEYANHLYVNGDLVTNVTIPDTAQVISDYLFKGCTDLESVTISPSVKSIGNSAFKECTSLKSVTIPQGVNSIGYSAFEGCTTLEWVTIPPSVKSIGHLAFEGCNALESVYISDLAAWCGIDFEAEYIKTSYGRQIVPATNPLYIAGRLYLNGEELTNLVIPDTVTKINAYTFAGGKNITSVTIPKSVNYIGKSAFTKCLAIEDVYAADLESWCKIKFDAFFKGDNVWPASPPTTTNPSTIGRHLYINGELLTHLDFPTTIKTVNDLTFAGCGDLVSANIPETVDSIGYAAFYSCKNLTDITLPDTLSSLEEFAFAYSGIKSLKMPKVRIIPRQTFYFCENLEEVTMRYWAERIGRCAFYGCPKLNKLEYPASIQYLGEDITSRLEGYIDALHIYFNGSSIVYLMNGSLYSKSNKVEIGTLWVPRGSKEKFGSQTNIWFKALNYNKNRIKEMPQSDVNGDMVADVRDVTSIISAVLSGKKSEDLSLYGFDLYDVNHDGVVDIKDVTFAINEVLE